MRKLTENDLIEGRLYKGFYNRGETLQFIKKTEVRQPHFVDIHVLRGE